MPSLTRTDLLREVARREDERLVNMILTALDPFRPDDFALYRMEESGRVEFRARVAEVALKIARKLRHLWHALPVESDPPNITRGTD